MGNYEINQGYVVLDENMEVVDWFDTLEEAEKYVEELENSRQSYCSKVLCYTNSRETCKRAEKEVL